MNDIHQQAREFFSEEEFAQYIEETNRLLAQGNNPRPDTAPFNFMLFLHDTYGVQRNEVGIVDGDVRLTVRASIRISQEVLRQPEMNPEQQDRIMDIINRLHNDED